MPLHELNHMAKGKVDQKEMNIACVADQSFVPSNDLFELVWENGPTCKSLPSHCPRGEVDLSQDQEVMPWLNFGMGESMLHEYNSDFLHELSGVTMNDSKKFPLLYRSNSNQFQKQSLQHEPCEEITQITSSSSRHDPIVCSNNSTMMNFSHFAKPAAVVKANLQNIGLTSGLSSSTSESVRTKNKGAVATTNNPFESKEVYLGGECPKESVIHRQQDMEPKSVEHDVDVSMKSDDPTCKKDVSKIDQTSKQVFDVSVEKGHEAAQEHIELAVVTSSVSSGNDAERCSENPNRDLKRKSLDTEDSEFQSQDVQEESVGVKKTACTRGGMGSKRNRSALVHNLSERRRRDRINERMRALQELIPNCNKVDKASMLDEAIEYLKTLQLQLQIMSMGGGLYMPRMMLPAGMQYMHAPHMPHFSPMSVGMQMGMGYGMCMPEVYAGSSRFPMAQVPQMQGTHIPMPNVLSQVTQHTNCCNSANQMSTQCEATIGGSKPSTSVLDNDNGHASLTNDRGAVDPGKEDIVVIDKSPE